MKSLFIHFCLCFVAFSALAAPGLPRAQKEVTLLVYYSGDNNLAYFMDSSMQKLVREGGSAQTHILVQFDGSKDRDATRFSLEEKSATSPTGQTIFEDSQEYDMGNTKTLTDFVSWGLQNFPAKKTILLINGHGRGILNLPLGDGSHFGDSSKVLSLASSSDDTSRSYMNEEDLVAGLKPVLGNRKLDLLIYDSCLMGNLEIMSLLSSVAHFAIASEYTIFVNTKDGDDDINGRSIPIENISKYLKANPQISERNLAKKIMADFYKGYQNFSSPAADPDFPGEQHYASTLAFYDLDQIDSLAREFTKMAQDFIGRAQTDTVLLKRFFQTQMTTFYVDSLGYIDSLVLFRNMAKVFDPETSLARIQKYEDLSSRVVLEKVNLYAESNGSLGHLSFFFPMITADTDFVNKFNGFYNDLKITQKYNWGSFLTSFRKLVDDHSEEFWKEQLLKWNQGAAVRIQPAAQADEEYFLFLYLDLLPIKWAKNHDAQSLKDYLQLLNSLTRRSELLEKHKAYTKQLQFAR